MYIEGRLNAEPAEPGLVINIRLIAHVAGMHPCSQTFSLPSLWSACSMLTSPSPPVLVYWKEWMMGSHGNNAVIRMLSLVCQCVNIWWYDSVQPQLFVVMWVCSSP